MFDKKCPKTSTSKSNLGRFSERIVFLFVGKVSNLNKERNGDGFKV
jgi:hypothetical protein